LDALDVGVTVDARDDATVEPKDPNIEKTVGLRLASRRRGYKLQPSSPRLDGGCLNAAITATAK